MRSEMFQKAISNIDDELIEAADDGKFSTYEMGRGINAAKVGQKISDVTVTAGWYYCLNDEWNAKEHARAETYEISGVSEDTAVAIKFLDELEAEVTDFYYVIINPVADKTPVQNYVIIIEDPANQDGGIVNEEIPE